MPRVADSPDSEQSYGFDITGNDVIMIKDIENDMNPGIDIDTVNGNSLVTNDLDTSVLENID